MAKSDIYIRIGAKLDGLQRGIRKSQSQLTRFANFAENTGRTLTTRLSLPIVAVGGAAVASFAQFEKLQNGLNSMAGSAEAGAAQLKRLQEIAKLPGISLEQAVKGSQQLQIVGFEAEQAETALAEFSKAVTLSGGGAEQLGSIVKQFTQINSKGRILQEDLGVILENVPSIGIALQDAFGSTSVEAIRASGVSAAEFTNKIVEAIAANEKFQNVQGGLSNSFDNFGQSVRFSLATLGQSIAESISLQNVLDKLSGFIDRVASGFKNLNPTVQKAIVYISAATATVGPLLFGIGAMIKAVLAAKAAFVLLSGTLSALFLNPIGLAIAALAGLAIAFKVAYEKSDNFRAGINGLAAVISNFVSGAVNKVKNLIDVFRQLYAGNIEAAAESARAFYGLGEKNGKTAGEAFSKAYNESISKSITGTAPKNFGTKGRLGGSVQRQVPGAATPPPDPLAPISPVPLPTISPLATAAKEIEINYDRATVAVERLNRSVTEGSIFNTGARFEEIGKPIQSVTAFLLNYGAEIDRINDKQEVFGGTFDGLSAKINATTAAMENALSAGYGPTSDVIIELKERLAGLTGEFNSLLETEEKMNALRAGITSITSAIADMAEKGAVSFKSFASAAVDAVSSIINILIQQAVAQLIAGSVKFAAFLGPAAIPVAVAAGKLGGALFSNLIKGITGLKDGGIIPPGYNNDTFPAMLSSGEAVIPLDKLSDMLSSGGGGTSYIRGSDIYLAYNREAVNQARIL